MKLAEITLFTSFRISAVPLCTKRTIYQQMSQQTITIGTKIKIDSESKNLKVRYCNKRSVVKIRDVDDVGSDHFLTSFSPCGGNCGEAKEAASSIKNLLRSNNLRMKVHQAVNKNLINLVI